MTKKSSEVGTSNTKNIVWHNASVSRSQLSQKREHQSAIIWFTGLSGSGKSTLANAVNLALFHREVSSYVLDGDNVRHGLCKDLGFSNVDRQENIRRIGEVSKLFLDAGIIVLTAFVSPFREDRQIARQLVEKGEFIEVYCSADLQICESRDTKGLYAQARQGKIKDFTGISSPYEAPEKPELVVQTGVDNLDTCVNQVLDNLLQMNIIN